MAPQSYLWRRHLPSAWFRARNAVWEYLLSRRSPAGANISLLENLVSQYGDS